MKKKWELVLDQKALLGESPSWDARHNVLYWVDSLKGYLHIYDPRHKVNRTIELGEQIGCVVPKSENEVALAMKSGYYLLNLETEKRYLVADPEKSFPDNSFNDGKCDPSGRFWAGTVNMKDAYKFTGSLYCLHANGKTERIFNSVGCSNGITWSPDYKTMYYIDTLAFDIKAFDYCLDTGKISKERIVVKIPERYKLPDGMTADIEGKLWVAHWDAAKVCRWDPTNGELLEYIEFPVPRISSCVFGGENLDELYVTSARDGLDEDIIKKHPHSGGLFRVKMDVQGLPTFIFKMNEEMIDTKLEGNGFEQTKKK